MKTNTKIRVYSKLLPLLVLGAFTTASTHAALLYSGDPGVTITGMTTVESGFESVYNTGSSTPFVSTNNLVKITGTTFASSELGGFESTMVQNITYPTADNSPGSPWLPTSNGTENVGITLSSPITIRYIGFGTQYTNRSSGDYTLQYTTDNVNWNSIGTVQLASQGNVLGRNLFDVGSLANVTGVRISGFPDLGASISVSEIEVYNVPEPQSIALVLGSLAGLTVATRRRRRAMSVLYRQTYVCH